TISVGNSSWVYEYEIVDEKSDRVIALGKTVQVAYDYGTKTPIAIPEELKRRRILEWLCKYENARKAWRHGRLAGMHNRRVDRNRMRSRQAGIWILLGPRSLGTGSLLRCFTHTGQD